MQGSNYLQSPLTVLHPAFHHGRSLFSVWLSRHHVALERNTECSPQQRLTVASRRTCCEACIPPQLMAAGSLLLVSCLWHCYLWALSLCLPGVAISIRPGHKPDDCFSPAALCVAACVACHWLELWSSLPSTVPSSGLRSVQGGYQIWSPGHGDLGFNWKAWEWSPLR